jgi:hypothetical protein
MDWAQDMAWMAAAMGAGAGLLRLAQRLGDDVSEVGLVPVSAANTPPADSGFLADLDRAMVDDHLYLAYQPKLDARAKRICGAEALLGCVAAS